MNLGDLGFGQLVQNIKHFEASYEGVNEHYPCVSKETQEMVLRKMIEDYRQDLMKTAYYGGLAPKYRKSAKKSLYLINKVIASETTLEKELAKHDLNREQFPREWLILLGSFDVVPAAQKIDETIKRLYWKQD